MATIMITHIRSLKPNSVAVRVHMWAIDCIAPTIDPSVIPTDIRAGLNDDVDPGGRRDATKTEKNRP